MTDNLEQQLSRRERQIMDAVFQLGTATVSDVRRQIPDPPSYSAVRRMMAILEEKGFLQHEWQGPRYVYSPAVDPAQARTDAFKRYANTFFAGSSLDAVAAAIDMSAAELSDEDFDRLQELIDRARKEDC